MTLEEHHEDLEKQRLNALANLNAIMGAQNMLKILIAERDAPPAETPPPAEDPT